MNKTPTEHSDRMSLDTRGPSPPPGESTAIYKRNDQPVQFRLELSSQDGASHFVWIHNMRTWSNQTGFQVMRNKDVVNKAVNSGNLKFQPGKFHNVLFSSRSQYVCFFRLRDKLLCGF
jgi:hypothetical protein